MTAQMSRLSDEQMRELGPILWQYRNALDRVEFLLEAQLMFAGAGREARLSTLADLLEETSAKIGELDLRRELLLHDSSDGESTIGIGNLSELVASVPEPWSSMFAEHQRWFDQSVARIKQLTAQARHTMGATLDLIHQLVEAEGGSSVTEYDRRGRMQRSSTPALLFDRQA